MKGKLIFSTYLERFLTQNLPVKVGNLRSQSRDESWTDWAASKHCAIWKLSKYFGRTLRIGSFFRITWLGELSLASAENISFQRGPPMNCTGGKSNSSATPFFMIGGKQWYRKRVGGYPINNPTLSSHVFLTDEVRRQPFPLSVTSNVINRFRRARP